MREDKAEKAKGRQSDHSVTESGDLTRRQILVRTGAFGAALTLPAFLAACGGSGGSSSGAQTGGAGGSASAAEIDNITWGVIGQGPTALDVARDFSARTLTATSLGLEGLLASDDNLQLKPALARGWSQPDVLHYVFDLRPGVKFWDGSPVTVDDVVFSLSRHMDESVASPISYLFINVKSIEAKGSGRVVVTMANPDPTLPQSMPIVPIVPKKFVEGAGESFGAPGPNVKIMGTGPYVITSFTTENGVEVKRNEAYWGKPSRVKSATLKYFETPQTMLLATRSGSIAGGFGFALSEAQSWSNLSGVDTEFLKEDGLTSVFLSLDFESEPWGDIHVRRALAHCCDTAGYAKAFLAGQATPAETIVPPIEWKGLISTAEQEAMYKEVPQYPFSISKAKAELAKSGYPDGFSETVLVPNTQPTIERALVSLSQALEKIGVSLTVKSVTENEWLAKLVGHKDMGMMVIPFQPDYNDPSDYPLLVYLSESAVPNAYNTANFKNPTVDRLLREQAEATDDKERARLLGEVLKISGEELPYVPLWWEGPTLAITEKYVYNGLNALYYLQPWLDSVGVRA